MPFDRLKVCRYVRPAIAFLLPVALVTISGCDKDVQLPGTYVAGVPGQYYLVGRDAKQIAPSLIISDYKINCDWPLPVRMAGGKWGYLDRSGKFLIEPQYEDATCFLGEYATVFLGRGHRIIRKDNSIKLEFPTTFEAESVGSLAEGKLTYRVQSSGMAVAGGGGRYGIMDENYQIFIQPKLDVATYFSEGLMAVSDFDLKGIGYIDHSARLVIPPIYYSAGPFRGGLARVNIEKNGKFGFITPNGQLKIPFQFDEAADFFEDLAAVRIGPLWGYISADGKMAISPQFYAAARFRDGAARVRANGKEQLIDKTGTAIMILPY